ncbi:vitamin B12 dependent methionine synthase [Slackia heliotrinireducens]|uniref:vitamin B12 dependent methionine synthase n=1 Tax=Slackia heliotrinireducens TaxID=84110 RepID=UPI00331587ED
MSRYQADKSETLRYLGYAGQSVDAALDARIDQVIAHCEATSQPRFVHRTFPLEFSSEGVKPVGAALVLKGEDIRRHLEGARACALLACTLGLANERELARMKAVGPVDALVYSCAGSSLVERVADACEAEIVAQAADAGLHANWRYSPGYGDFPLEIQSAFVRALGADKMLGITVTDTDLLIPSKSVTAVIGLFDEVPANWKRNCDTCVCAPYCSLRKAGTPCWQ